MLQKIAFYVAMADLEHVLQHDNLYIKINRCNFAALFLSRQRPNHENNQKHTIQ